MTGTSQTVAIVTGISKGYGKAIARDLVANGWYVVGNGRDASSLADAAADIGQPDRLTTVAGDLSNEAHLYELVSAATDAGDLRLVVNNAAVISSVSTPRVNEMPADDLLHMFAVNVVAPTRLSVIAMAEAAPKIIINVTSAAASFPTNRFGGYGATKAALEHITAVQSIENPDMHFYTLDPGPMATEMFQAGYPDQDSSTRPRPDDRAAAVRLLASRQPHSSRFVAREVIDMYA